MENQVLVICGRERVNKRRRVGAVLGALSLALMGMVGTSGPVSAGPVGTAAGFEDDDGNLAPQAHFDWNSFDPTTWTGSAPDRSSSKTTSGWAFVGLEDAAAATSDSAFAGGTKQDDDCASVIGAKAPNKDDLKRVYVASNTVNGDVFLNLAWVRIPQNTTSPSAHIGFEFNQATTPPGPCPAGSNGLVHRKAGDMLIVYDFEGGATDTPTITLRRWVTTGSCEVGSDVPPCWAPSINLTALGFAEAKVNTGASALDAIAPADETLELNEFGEAGINLTDAGVFPANTCVAFGKTFAVSRSSGNSATAQMKDLVGPGSVNVSNCGRVIIRKVTSPSPDTTDTSFAYTTTGGLDPATFTLKNGQSRDYGATVFTGNYTVTESNPGPNFALTGLSCAASSTTHGTTISPSVATRTVSFNLKPLDTVDCTFTNTVQRGALRILKKSTKSGNPLVSQPGATFSATGPVSFTVRDNNVAPAGSKSDASTTVGDICVSGLPIGSYTINETAPPRGYGGATQANLTATVASGTNCSGNPPAAAATVTFTNAPLADIQVNFRDGGSGETSVQSIDCSGLGSSPDHPDGTPANGWDSSVTHEDVPVNPSPRTVTCTIVMDP